ncbi:MAG: OmpA family protein [Alphaproteobacteria bacterium]
MITLARTAALSAALLSLTVLGGCATKDYVNQAVSGVDAKVSGVDAKVAATQGQLGDTQKTVAGHGTQLGALDKSTREALDRATAAGKLAEGKFLYSMVLSDDSVKFPVNAAQLSPEAQTRLADFASKLKGDNRNVYLEIQGHTDSTGKAAANMKLGEDRAEAVRRFLNIQGVALNRMSTISYGPDQPVANNKTKDGRGQNRRVVLVVLN